MEAYVNAISFWLPDAKLTNKDINDQHPEWSIEKISLKTGIEVRGVSTVHETVSEMSTKVGEKLFSEHFIDRNLIDFLIVCTQSPDYFLPTTACIVQSKLKLRTSVGAFDFNLGCSGFVYGLGIAKGMIASGSARNVLLITAETYSKFIHPDDKSNKTIFGDASAATWVSADKTDKSFRIGNFVYGTDGTGAENLIVVNGAAKNPHRKGEDILNSEDQTFARNDNNLYMNGAEIFKFTAEKVPLLIAETLLQNQLESKNIDLYIFHQANQYMLEFLRKKANIPVDKFYIFIKNCGNTVSSTIPIALKDAIDTGRIAAGNRLMLAGFGVGYSWAACVIEKD